MKKLYGLVLSGGKSTRMGADKGRIEYHGVPQQEYLYQLLEKFCDVVFLSIRSEQLGSTSSGIKTILDNNKYQGPFNGILSAHHKFPEVTWLVIACDLPLLDSKAIAQLIKERDSTKIATTFSTKESKMPEPLCAIWEVEGLKKAKEFLNKGESKSPRKFLTQNNVVLVVPDNEDVLLNANSKEVYEIAKLKIKGIEK